MPMSSAFKSIALILTALLLVSCAAQNASRNTTPDSPQAKEETWVSFDVMVTSVDDQGGFHMLFNYAQGLKPGDEWQQDISGVAGTMNVKVTWQKMFKSFVPSIACTIYPKESTEAEVLGYAKLESTVWEYLYGPEAFVTDNKEPFILPGYGRPVIVSAVVEKKEPRE